MDRELIAAFEYEYNDGDQCWTDSTEFFRNPNGSFIEQCTDGYNFSTNTRAVTFSEIKTIMDQTQEEVNRRESIAKKIGWQHPSTRSGYKILVPLNAEILETKEFRPSEKFLFTVDGDGNISYFLNGVDITSAIKGEFTDSIAKLVYSQSREIERLSSIIEKSKRPEMGQPYIDNQKNSEVLTADEIDYDER